MANSSVIKYAECACVSLVHSFHVTFMFKLVNLQTFQLLQPAPQQQVSIKINF